MNLKFSRQSFENIFEIKYFMKIHTVGDEFFFAERRTEGQ